MKETVLIDLRPLARRSPLFASLFLHCVLVSVMAFWPSKPSIDNSPVQATGKRSVVLLHLQNVRHSLRNSTGSPAEARGPAGSLAGASGPMLRLDRRGTSSEGSQAQVADLTREPEQARRRFEVPAALPVRPLKQTIIQLDVPPDTVLEHEIPLPDIISWTPQQPIPAFRKQFVTPPLKEMPKRVAQSLPPAPTVELPNREIAVSDLELASALAPARPHLILPPVTKVPVRLPKADPVNQVPQIVMPEPSSANTAVLIALGESPVRPEGVIIVPPANQVGSSGPSGQGSREDGRDSGRKGGQKEPKIGSGGGDGMTASGGSGPGAGVSGVGHGDEGTGADGGGSGKGAGPGTLAGRGNQPGTALSGLGSAGAGTTGSGTADTGGPDLSTEGLTRINLPKDGKYGVVVFGSSQAAPYPESEGALSGKMIYTVYLGVGLHKKWILQYCLTKAAEMAAPKGSATPVDAPWPFLIFRPDHLTGSNDYVIVRGVIDVEGRFDQLAMVFPDQFDQKELLISSLKRWSFRPASRDREPTAVEVLLIIPTES